MPSRRFSPLPANHSVLGATPMPTTTTSLPTTEPSRRRTPVTWPPLPSMPAICTPQRRSTPLRPCTPATAAPIATPRPRTSGEGAPSSTVTAHPRPRAVAATSRPMKPAPMMVTRAVPSAMRSRRSVESARVRSSTMPSSAGWSGNLRGEAPVAMTRPSKATVEPFEASSTVTTRASRSSAVARTPSRRSRPSEWKSSGLRRRIRSGSHSPANTFFDSGGRS